MMNSKSSPEDSERNEESEQEQHESRNQLARSCYTCSRRKVRCNKKKPCAACIRSGKPASCSYPEPGPRKRRTKKTILADMTSRISSLEQSLVQKNLAKEQNFYDSGLQSPTSQTTDSMMTMAPPATRKSHSSVLNERSREDIYVQKGSTSQYFNEIFLSRVIEEEQDLESALTTPVTQPSIPSASPFDALGILSAPSLSTKPSDSHPQKFVAVKLWNAYLNTVEGCAGLKLLHVPTDEVSVFSTIDNPSQASLENLALCLAIYYSAAVSLEDAEARSILGEDVNGQLLILKLGLEQAFAHANFLDRPTITGLRALAIYLSALRVHNHGKGIWILNGLAIRIAESLGLHHDGERLGVSPFQSELRRRLWWHFLTRDGRGGEDYGLENTRGLLLTHNVSLPLNVDDSELDPDMTELPAPKEGWTAMTFSLVNCELFKTMQKLASLTMSPSSPPGDETRAQIINESSVNIEKQLKYCNPVIPAQRITLYCSRFLLRKLDFVTKQQWLLLKHPESRQNFATEESLLEALEILEPNMLSQDDQLLKQYAWAKKAFPQYYVAMYILWHLCVKPEGPNVDRAWDVVGMLFTRERWDQFTPGFGSKAAVLEALRAKALSARAKSQAMSGGADLSSTGALNMQFAETNMPNLGGTATYLSGDVGAGDFGFDLSSDDWNNWATFMQAFPPEGQAWAGVF